MFDSQPSQGQNETSFYSQKSYLNQIQNFLITKVTKFEFDYFFFATTIFLSNNSCIVGKSVNLTLNTFVGDWIGNLKSDETGST